MTANQRIVLNIAASYGRSVFGMLCGLFSTRWVLMALGQTDMGLYGVVGSLTLLVSFFNIQFSAAIGRFFAFAIGQAKVNSNAAAGLEECQRWFNVALSIHTVVPLILVIIGYPIGAYVITHDYLVIPPDKIEACVWVWRFSCLSCFVGMLNTPFYGMYTAKQYIAELTIYNVFQTAARTAFIYFMTIRPGEWLTRYAFAMMLVSVIPQLIICVRALQVFPECRIVPRFFWSLARVRQVVIYVVWQVVGSLGYVARTSGVAVVVNRFFGPKVNAAMSVGNMLASETSVLTGALSGAFIPVLATACGAGDLDYMRKMAFRACKFGTLLTLLFALPLALEVDEVLRLWLKNPPDCASELCLSLLFCIIVEKLTLGHTLAVNASGRLARYQTIHGLTLGLVLPVAIVACLLKVHIWSIGLSLMGSMVVSILGDVWVARHSVGMSARYWLRHIVLPILLVCIITLALGSLPHLYWSASFLRVVITSAASLLVFTPLCWFLILESDEKSYLVQRLRGVRLMGGDRDKDNQKNPS